MGGMIEEAKEIICKDCTITEPFKDDIFNLKTENERLEKMLFRAIGYLQILDLTSVHEINKDEFDDEYKKLFKKVQKPIVVTKGPKPGPVFKEDS